MPIIHIPIKSVIKHHLLSPPARNTPTAVVILNTFKQLPSAITINTLDAKPMVSAGRSEKGEKISGSSSTKKDANIKAAIGALTTNRLAI